MGLKKDGHNSTHDDHKHSHNNSSGHSSKKSNTTGDSNNSTADGHNIKGLTLAFWLNLMFSIIELIGGILTNSTAIMADALHDFTDAMAIGLAVWLEKISGKPATDTFTYGFKRFSLLSALGMSLFLLIGAVFMIGGAMASFINPKQVHSVGMLGLALLGITVNGLALLNMKGGHHPHSHSHSHSHSHKQNTHNHDTHNAQNHNSRAIMLHLLEDLLGWVAVLIGAVIIYFTNWYWLDGVLAIGIALFIAYNAYYNIKDTLKVLMLATPSNVNVQQLTNDMMMIESVDGINKLRIWSLDGNQHIASLTLTVKPKTDKEANNSDVYKNTVKLVTELFHRQGVKDVTIQIEV